MSIHSLYRIEHTPLIVNMGDHFNISNDRIYGTSNIRHTNAGCIDHTANDIFHGTGTNVMAARIADGNTERSAYSQFDG